MTNRGTSRRAALAALAGAAVTSGGILRAATLRRRSLVAIRVADPSDAAEIYRSGLFTAGLHPALSYCARRVDRHAAVVIDEELPAESEFGYLPGGFAVPGWLMRAAGATVIDHAGRAWTFRSGLVMLTPGGLAQNGLSLEGAPLDNPALLEIIGESHESFPATSIGRQLSQAAALLASGSSDRMMFAATLAGPVSIAEHQSARATRLKDLDAALAAFEEALNRLGIASEVTSFTESHAPSPARSARLVLGGAVAAGSLAGGEAYRAGRREHSGVALAQWAGLSADLFPGFVAPPVVSRAS